MSGAAASCLQTPMDEGLLLGAQIERRRLAGLILSRMSAPLATLLQQCAQPELKGLLETTRQRLTAVLVALHGDDAQALAQAALSWMQEFTSGCAAAGIEPHCRADCLPADIDVDAHRHLAIARTVREATANIVRHSGATRAHLVITAGDGSIAIDISDNGGGRAAGLVHGRGLLGMARRAFALDGHLNIGDGDDGLRLRLTLPLLPLPSAASSPERGTPPASDLPSIALTKKGMPCLRAD